MRAYLAMAVSYVGEMFMKLTPGIIVIKHFFFATDSGTKKLECLVVASLSSLT
jgi:hypothetical protein